MNISQVTLTGAVLLALTACGPAVVGQQAAPPGPVASPTLASTTDSVATPTPTTPGEPTATQAQLEGVAAAVFPLIQPGPVYGVCGANGQLAACPFTDRLKSRLGQLRETLLRAQNPSPTREVTVEVTATGGIAHVRLFRGTKAVDLVVIHQASLLLVDDEICTGRPETSIYSAPLTVCE